MMMRVIIKLRNTSARKKKWNVKEKTLLSKAIAKFSTVGGHNAFRTRYERTCIPRSVLPKYRTAQIDENRSFNRNTSRRGKTSNTTSFSARVGFLSTVVNVTTQIRVTYIVIAYKIQLRTVRLTYRMIVQNVYDNIVYTRAIWLKSGTRNFVHTDDRLKMLWKGSETYRCWERFHKQTFYV